MTTFQWKRLKAVLWTIAAFLVLLWAGKIVVEYFIILLVFLAYFTLLYNIGTLVAASLFHIKVEEISVGLGRRFLAFSLRMCSSISVFSSLAAPVDSLTTQHSQD